MKVLKNPPLYKKVAGAILDRIQKRDFDSPTLPSEESLSDLLGTSKHTIREALAELASLSYISRRHGHGNVILNSVIDTTFRIDANMNFFKILEQAGHETSIEYTNLRMENRQFTSCSEEDYYFYNEIVKGDDKVASFHDIYIPVRLLPSNFNLDTKLDKGLFDFLATYGVYSLHSIVEFIPEIVDDTTAQLFSIEPNTPINTWEEYIYDQEDRLVCITKIRFNPELFKLRMVRKDFKTI
ncbi:MAG: GntR family transcriptional regulator [Firmicutes bacterium]|nr:GntR family transcriptional regulator [Bacillota bacterium]